MKDNENYFKNRVILKRCERIYKLIFLVYFTMCIPYAVAIFIYAGLSGFISDCIPTLALSSVLALGLFVAGLLSVYKKEVIFSFIPGPVSLLLVVLGECPENILLDLGMNFTFIFVSFVASAILIPVHSKYRWLEQQEGFPYFNERFEDNRNNLQEYNENNPFENAIEKYRSASSGKMDDI